MNYLAHLFLSQPTVESRVGNMMGDFLKGVTRSELSDELQSGIDNHLLVDRVCDGFLPVKDARKLFPQHQRRFAGVAMDVIFDHFLIRDWSLYSEQPRDVFIKECYQDLLNGRDLMHPRMLSTVQKIVSQDWLNSYEETDQLGYALDRIASRIRFENQFHSSIETFYRHEAELKAVFDQLMPELIRVVGERQGNDSL